jgi:retinol dehydrogenase 12
MEQPGMSRGRGPEPDGPEAISDCGTWEAFIYGKVVVITGATSGIGRIAAERLAGLGARIVMVARDRERGEQTLSRLREVAPNLTHRAHYGDLSLLADVRRVGTEIVAAEPRVDALVNNAGNIFGTRKVTTEGLERTFALNHMAYFVLTHCLRERLFAAAPARIVSTASGARCSISMICRTSKVIEP